MSLRQSGERRGGLLGAPLSAWTNRTFLYFSAANLLLRSSLALFRAGILPRALLLEVLAWARQLAARGLAHLRCR